MPVLAGFQVNPASVERMTPLSVASKASVPTTVSARVICDWPPLQLSPLFVERKTPFPCVPARSTVPNRDSVFTVVFVNPEFAADHVAPLFVDRKTPPAVPANKEVPFATKELTVNEERPTVSIDQLAP